MKKLGTSIIIFVLALSVSILCGVSRAASSPKAIFPQASFSAGEIKQGSPVVHTFRVLNQGQAPLNIVRVRPG